MKDVEKSLLQRIIYSLMSTFILLLVFGILLVVINAIKNISNDTLIFFMFVTIIFTIFFCMFIILEEIKKMKRDLEK